MAESGEFLTLLVRRVLGRGADEVETGSGVAHALARPATTGSVPVIASGPSPQQDTEEPAGSDPDLLEILGEKVLLSWLRNRHQLLFPVAFDLHRLDRAQAELLIHAMIAASEADGALESKEQERIEGALALVDAAEDEEGFLKAAMANPRPLTQVLREVRDVQTGALVYAASLMAVDQRKPVNRLYLRYLAARLQLSEELVGSLEQRFRSSG